MALFWPRGRFWRPKLLPYPRYWSRPMNWCGMFWKSHIRAALAKFVNEVRIWISSQIRNGNRFIVEKWRLFRIYGLFRRILVELMASKVEVVFLSTFFGTRNGTRRMWHLIFGCWAGTGFLVIRFRHGLYPEKYHNFWYNTANCLGCVLEQLGTPHLSR